MDGRATSNSATLDAPVVARVERPPRRRPGDTVLLIRGFALPVVIGVSRAERLAVRTLKLDLDIGLASRAACTSDALADTIDYARVIERLRAEVAGKAYHLLEFLAEQLAAVVLDEFGAAWVRVAVMKSNMFEDVVATGVEVWRERRRARRAS